MNNDYSKEIAHYFEKIRQARKLSQEEFTDGIVSIRQYRRYLDGTSSISPQIMSQIAKKCGIESRHIFRAINKERLKQLSLIKEYYNTVSSFDFSTAEKLKSKIEQENIKDEFGILLFKFALLTHDALQKKITTQALIQESKKLINFPDVLKLDNLSGIEFLILSSLIRFKDFKEHKEVADVLNKQINNQLVVVDNRDEFIVLLCIFNLAKYYGMQKQNEKVILLCNQGLDYNLSMNTFYLKDYFYYYKALAYRNLNQDIFKDEMLYRLFCVLESENIPTKSRKFTKWVEKDFDINYLEFIQAIGSKYMFKHDQ